MLQAGTHLDASYPSFFQVNQEVTGTALSQWPFCLAPNSSFTIPDRPDRRYKHTCITYGRETKN